MNRYLVSVTTPDYVHRAGRYFNSVCLMLSAIPRVVLLEFNENTDPEQKVERALRETLDWIGFGKMSLPFSHSYNMIQHGCFLSALPEIQNNDLVCLTDLDIQIQRDFYEWEWTELEEKLGDNQIGVSYNGTAADRLSLEAERIDLSEEWLEQNTDSQWLKEAPCYNCGVMIARASVFLRIQEEYESLCYEFYKNAPHRSRCQFLINLVWWRLGIEIVNLPGQIHVNGHFRLPETGEYLVSPGVHTRRDVLCFNGLPVIFRHAI